MIRFDPSWEIEFEYNGKYRTGHVEHVGDDYFILCHEDETYKTYSFEKIGKFEVLNYNPVEIVRDFVRFTNDFGETFEVYKDKMVFRTWDKTVFWDKRENKIIVDTLEEFYA